MEKNFFMNGKKPDEIFFNHMPMLNIWHKAIFLYSYQILLFVLTLFFYWYIGNFFLYGALLAQLFVSIFLSLYFIYIANYSKKIREKFRGKYKEKAGQHFWLKYLSLINPVVSAAFYFPLLLKQNLYFFPPLIKLPSHFLSRNIFPEYIAIPLGLTVIFVGFLIRRPSGGYGVDVDSYLYMIYPEKGKLITSGIFQYIRNPQYLCRGFISTGFGIFSNNLLAVTIGLIHFFSYCAIIPAEDRELKRRFGKEFENYKKNTPSLFPKFKFWYDFIKYIFRIQQN